MLYATHAHIHLQHIRENLEGIRAAVGKDRKVLIAVKANAYGHGAVEVSRMAERLGLADWLGVATVPEGIALRRSGIRLPILKLSHAFPEEMNACVTYGLTQAVVSRENAAVLENVCRSRDAKATVHMKVDTGMGRIGVEADQATDLAAFIAAECPHLNIQGIFTHLPVSDDGEPDFTQAQLARFKQVIADVEAALGRPLELKHASNSGAVLGHGEGWLDMVRPGVMIYGFYPSREVARSIDLKPAMSLFTRVSFLKSVKAGTTIGYGRTWAATRDTVIATIPVGYADGFNRLFSNKGSVLIKGREYPIVGRVCMDQSMVDLGPDSGVELGDEVVLMGRSGDLAITGDDWAERLGTINYEVTCRIDARVERTYDPFE